MRRMNWRTAFISAAILLFVLAAGCLGSCASTDPTKRKLKEFRRSNWALLIIDIQKGYLPFHHQGTVIRNTLLLREAADEAGAPVIYIRQNDGIAKQGTTAWEFHQAITPREKDYIVDKERPSGFSGTNLEDLLRDLEIGTLTAVGISTTHCYASTVIDAASRGYNVVVPTDGHSNSYPNAQELINAYNERFAAQNNMVVLPAKEIEIPRRR